MKLIITKKNLGATAAALIQARWQARKQDPFVLGLPTGGTVEDMYAGLKTLVEQGRMTFKNIITFNMDEYVGLAPQHEQSYHYYMNSRLFSHVDADAKNVHILDGQATDLNAQCAAYEAAIKQAGGIDLFLGGVGRNGHVAFNEPGSAFDSRTRAVDLTKSTIEANSRYFANDPAQVPTKALTVGIGTVLDARELLFLASGKSKAEAVRHLIHGEVTTAWPITALRTHPNAALLADPEAASELDSETRARVELALQNNPDEPVVLTL